MDTNDKSFKQFTEKVIKHNKNDFLLQALQVKYESELAGEDEERHREQLDHLAEILDQIENSITGLDIGVSLEPIENQLKGQTQILQNLLEEQTLTRKLTEGSLSFSKGDYRNLSGRKIQSDVTGNTIKKGGFIDFETASNRLAGQSEGVIARAGKEAVSKELKASKDLEETTADLIESNKTLNRSIKDIPKFLGKSFGKLSDFRLKGSELTTKEHIKEDISLIKTGLKSIGRGIAATAGGIGKGLAATYGFGKNVITDPSKAKEQVIAAKNVVVGAAKNVKDTVVDVVGVSSDYTAEKERFAKEFVRQGKGSTEEGFSAYKNIRNKEYDIKDVKSKIENSKKLGFEPLQADVDRLSSLKSELDKLKDRGGIGQDLAPVKLKQKGKKEADNQDTTNAESDNVRSSQEIISDELKDSIGNSKESLEIQKDQLVELKLIKEAVSPKTPNELSFKPGAILEEPSKSSSGNDDALELGSSISDFMSGGKPEKKSRTKKTPKSPKGKPGPKLGKALKGLGKFGGRIAGGAIATGIGAYEAYTEWGDAEGKSQADLEEIQAKLDSGEISIDEANKARKEIGKVETTEKSEAVGKGTGIAAGAIAGGAIGASIGSVVPIIGTTIGGLAGSAIGGFAGSEAGQWLGNKVSGFLNKEEEGSTVTPISKQPVGFDVSKTSVENADLARESTTGAASLPPIISSSNSVVNNTTYTGPAPAPRPDLAGSALDRYHARITSY